MKNMNNCTILLFLFLLSGCDKKPAPILETSPTVIFESFEYNIPNGFYKNTDDQWIYRKDRTIGTIKFVELDSEDKSIDSIFSDFESDVLEGGRNEYDMLNTISKSDGVLAKVRFYRKYENKHGGFAVYTFHSVGIINFGDRTLAIKTISLGFDLNPTIEASFFKTREL